MFQNNAICIVYPKHKMFLLFQPTQSFKVFIFALNPFKNKNMYIHVNMNTNQMLIQCRAKGIAGFVCCSEKTRTWVCRTRNSRMGLWIQGMWDDSNFYRFQILCYNACIVNTYNNTQLSKVLKTCLVFGSNHFCNTWSVLSRTFLFNLFLTVLPFGTGTSITGSYYNRNTQLKHSPGVFF